ncbi:MAG: hypothetical protein AAFY57_16160 [Cyanobacteria bacterium J06642_2]
MSELSHTQVLPVSPVLHAQPGTEEWPAKVTSTDIDALLNTAAEERIWQDTLTRNWPLVMLAVPCLVLAAVIGWVSRP